MSSRHLSTAVGGLAFAAFCGQAAAQAPSPITITGQTAGPRPFIEFIAATSTNQIASVNFTITPMAGSFTRPISATYSAAYLTAHNYLNGTSLNLPVFGLYSNYSNTVTLNFTFTDATTATTQVSVSTASYTDPCGPGNIESAQFTQYRTSTAGLSFDYYLLKNFCSADTPFVMDTDGNIRWVSLTGATVLTTAFYNNMVYSGDGRTGVNQVTLAGVETKIGDYATSQNVTNVNHHNIDPARNGMALEVNTTTQTESTVLEIDTSGKVLQRWDLDKIISAAMVAGGDDPSGFVFPVGNDWFHNNATTYDPVHNWEIVSSRENFVIAVDYDAPADGSERKIHWILGDATKHWYQYPSLRAFALTLGAHTIAPIGQHGIAFDHEGNLRMFDDGYQSAFQMPPGISRKYSAGRAYKIDPVAMTAQEDLAFTNHFKKYAFVCSSFYEDAPKNNLIDYASLSQGKYMDVQGYGPKFTLNFDLFVTTNKTCGSGWNAIEVHWENLQF